MSGLYESSFTNDPLSLSSWTQSPSASTDHGSTSLFPSVRSSGNGKPKGVHASYLTSLRSIAPSSVALSRKYRLRTQLPYGMLSRLDRTEVLGGSCSVLDSSGGQQLGHTGCVNALAWSPDGMTLASGSDDTKVMLWRVGGQDRFPNADIREEESEEGENDEGNEDTTGFARHTASFRMRMARREARRRRYGVAPSFDGRSAELTSSPELPRMFYPNCTTLDFGLQHLIQTGHRANIFSVKFAPFCDSSRIFTAAGDAQVRVFDLQYSAPDVSSRQMSDGREYSIWNEGGGGPRMDGMGSCTRVFRCHTARAKRIATEQSPDTFLTASEDGTVRQMDLRVPHNCGTGSDYRRNWFSRLGLLEGAGRASSNGNCPRPLCEHSMELYSFSLSKLEPHLFAVAGTDRYAYLYDRRMVRSVLARDWGHIPSSASDDNALTKVVRRFGLPLSEDDEGPTARGLADDEEDDDERERAAAARRRRKRMMSTHITAAKISENRPSDLLLSYSGHGIFRYNIKSGEVERQFKPGVDLSGLREADDDTNEDVDGISPDEAASLRDEPSRKRRREESISRDSEPPLQEGVLSTSPISVTSTLFCEHYGWPGGEMYSDDDDDRGFDIDDDDENDDFDDDDDGEYVMGEYEDSSEAFDSVPIVRPLQQAYTGHRNVETVKDVNFAGPNDEWVVSGSDDGNLFAWDTETGELVGIWRGDGSVVNVCQPHPYLPAIAVSGIDDTIKIFSPVGLSCRKRYDVFQKKDDIVQENTPVHSNEPHGAADDMTNNNAPSEELLQLLLDPAARRNFRVAVTRAGRRETGSENAAEEDGEAGDGEVQGEEPECTFA